MKRFTIQQTTAVRGYKDCELMLRAYGIEVFGRAADGKTISFQVRDEQAAWAGYLLRQKGLLPANGRDEAGKLPPAWGVKPRVGWMTRWVDFLADLLGAPQ